MFLIFDVGNYYANGGTYDLLIRKTDIDDAVIKAKQLIGKLAVFEMCE